MPEVPVDVTYVLDLQLKWIERSDTKAFFLVSLCLAMLGSLVALLGERDVSDVQFKFSIAVYFLLCGLSLASGIHSVFPKLNGPKESGIYFGGIAKKTADDYRIYIAKLTPERHLQDTVDQIHVNAQIAQRKFESVKFSMHMFGFSIPFWTLSIYGAT